MQTFITPQAISAYIICEKQFLLIRRCGPLLHGTWQMVTGGIHEGEKAWECALREIQEETGLIPDRFYLADAVDTFYMKSIDKIVSVPNFVAFVDSPGKVRLAPKEHDAFEWLPYEQALERLVFAEQKRVLTHVYHNFVLKEPLRIFAIES